MKEDDNAPGGQFVASGSGSHFGDRDRAALGRDEAAEARDRAADRRDQALARRGDDLVREVVALAATDRRRAAADRRHAAEDRGRARLDRVTADRDELTGAMGRGAGLRALERELARARRSGEPLTLAFVDVDGVKKVNDTQGHAAGDELLRSVVVVLRAGLRVSDLIIRYGGDEFLCALPGASVPEAARRLDRSAGVLANVASRSVTVGLAELRPDEDVASLIARADGALYAKRAASRR